MSTYKFPDSSKTSQDQLRRSSQSEENESIHPYSYSYSLIQPIASTSKLITTTTNNISTSKTTQSIIIPFNPYTSTSSSSSNLIESRKSSSANSSSFSSGGGDYEEGTSTRKGTDLIFDPSLISSLNSNLSGSGSSSVTAVPSNIHSNSGRRKGSNSSSRRMIDGREETREERRIRRDNVDLNNYDLTNGREGDEFTAARRHRARSHLPVNSPPLPSSSLHSPPIASTSTSSTSYFPSTSTQSTTTSPPINNSKSVLTIALQRAQSAVLLDSANNVPEAIAAYSQSVKLLKEVIIRAEESLERERERERVRKLTVRSKETEEDKVRRSNRFEKKEKAKLDEGRRLKVIHDTYEDRIGMLISMGGNSTETTRTNRERSLPTSPTSPTTLITNSRSPTIANQSHSPRMRRHRAESSLGSLSGFMSSDSPNTSPHPPPSIPLPLPPPDSSTLGDPISWNSTIRPSGLTPPLRDVIAAEGIGSAMLVAITPPTSPTINPAVLPSTPPTNRPSRLSRELLGESGGGSDGESTPRNFVSKLVQSTRIRKSQSSDVSSIEESRDERLTPTLMRRTASEQPPFSSNQNQNQNQNRNRNSSASVFAIVATSHALSRNGYSTDSTASNSTVPESTKGTSTSTNTTLSRDSSQTFSSSSELVRTPLIAIEPGSPMDPFFYFDSPSSDTAENKEILLEDEKETGIHADHGINFDGGTSNGIGWDSNVTNGNGISSFNSRGSATPSVGHSRNHSQSSTNSSIPRSTSGNSISSNSNSNSNSRGSPSLSSSSNYNPNHHQHSYNQQYTSSSLAQSTASLLNDSPTLREERSGSLSNSLNLDIGNSDIVDNRGQFAAFSNNIGTTASYKDGQILINQSTTGGTISKRRKGSLVLGIASSTGEEFALEESKYQREETGIFSDDGSDADDGALIQQKQQYSSSSIRAISTFDSNNVDSEFGQLPSTLGYSTSSLNNSNASNSSNTSNLGRLRALSQPGRRPPLPNFDQSIPAVPFLPPSRSTSSPRFMRKSSTPFPSTLVIPPPLLNRSHSTSSKDSLTNSAIELSRGASPFTTTNSSLDTPLSASFSTSIHRPHLTTSLSSSSTHYLLPPPPPEALPAIPVPPIRRPFQLMRQILQSIESGGYVTPKLYIPQPTWSQTGVKLTSLETKVRMLDLLLNGLELVEKSGEGMLMEFQEGEKEMARMESGRFGKELEGFEGLVEGIQNTLEKKLGYATSGKKMGTTSFSAWSSKLSRSLDRVTSGRSLDSPATYVEGIARVFKLAQNLDQHILYLSSNEGGYSNLTIPSRQKIEIRLKRLSDFFGQVICRFVLKDLGMLLDKYVKRGSGYLMFD